MPVRRLPQRPVSGAAASLMALLALTLAACTGPYVLTGPPDSPQKDLAAYRQLPDYRAFATTGIAPDRANYAAGWGSAASSIEGAIETALNECGRRREPATQPPCILRAIGDLEVAGQDSAGLEVAKCLYILNPRASTLDDPNRPRCAAALTGAARPAARPVALSAAEIESRIIGNTLVADRSAYIFLRNDGRAVLRTADVLVGPDVGSWRLTDTGLLCTSWGKAAAFAERCQPITRHGERYGLAATTFTVLPGNPFGL